MKKLALPFFALVCLVAVVVVSAASDVPETAPTGTADSTQTLDLIATESSTEAPDWPAAQIERLAYLLSQGLKEDLVERVENWPGIHFGKQLLEGRSLLVGKWVDRTRKYRLEMQRRGKENEKHQEISPDEYTATLTVELKPLPCLKHLGWGGYVRFVTELIRGAERDAAESRKRRGVEVVGAEEICRHDPQTRPNRVKASPAPAVHAASKKARLEWREAFGMFLLAYREAAKLLRKGVKDATFPESCFPPGLPFVGATGEPVPSPG